MEKEARGHSGESMVKEPYSYGTSAMKEGGYTIEDYYALPEERRVELIDGVFYDMGAPTQKHQLLIGGMYVQIYRYIGERGGSCVPYLSPTDVQLDGAEDDKTMVQPDLIIVCDEKKRENPKRIIGAPDFVAEVLSPSTRKKDRELKWYKYRNVGVREYWLVDPDGEKVYVYDWTGEGKRDGKEYTFEDKVPVGIYAGDLKIDFSDMLFVK